MSANQNIGSFNSTSFAHVDGYVPHLELDRSFDWRDIAIFFVPALKFLEVNIGGSWYGGDLVLFALLAHLFQRKGSWAPLRASLPKTVLVLGSLWFLSQVVTDFIRQTSLHDCTRGWARILITLVHFSVLYILLHANPRRIVIYGSGLVAGSILTYLFNPFVFARQYPWEFGWGFPVTLTLILVTSGRTYRSLLLLVLAGGLNLFLAFRSLGAVCLIVAIYLALRIRWQRIEARRQSRIKAKEVVCSLLVVCIGIWAIATVYERAASSGLLGDQAKYKYEFQSSGQYGFLLGGRSEIILGLLAIYDSPMIGHGSWAKDPDYVAAYQAVMLLLGYDEASFQRGHGVGIGSEDNDYLIVAHSHILGSWVEAGIVGALFWAWILLLAFRSLRGLYLLPDSLATLGTFCTFWLIWYVCFEPYGGDLRFSTLYYVIVVMSSIAFASRKLVASSRGKMVKVTGLE